MVKNNVRTYSREEDELILRQSKGEMSFKQLRERLQTGEVALKRRFEELDLKVSRKHSAKHRKEPSSESDMRPVQIKDDKYLTRLLNIYGASYLTPADNPTERIETDEEI